MSQAENQSNEAGGSDLFSVTIGISVVAVNLLLSDAPETVNSDLLGEVWFLKMQPDNPADLESLMDQDATVGTPDSRRRGGRYSRRRNPCYLGRVGS